MPVKNTMTLGWLKVGAHGGGAVEVTQGLRMC